MAGTSSFTEGSSVFGGQSNLLTSITNIFGIYKPDVIAIHTTCLSETIGDDLLQITKKADDEGKIPEGKAVAYANTPSYVGSHVTGFSNMVKAMAALAEPSVKKNGKINVIPGWVEPCDMEEIKRLASGKTQKIADNPSPSSCPVPVVNAGNCGRRQRSRW